MLQTFETIIDEQANAPLKSAPLGDAPHPVRARKEQTMELKKYIYWQDEDMWLGYLEEYPDYITQGETIEELEENLRDIYKELSSGSISWLNNTFSEHMNNSL